MALEVKNARAKEPEIVANAIAGIPAMTGTYNRTDNGYDFCGQGVAVYRNLNPGDAFRGTATLLYTPGADPNYILNIHGNDSADDGVRRLFKQILLNEPVTKFASHAQVVGDGAYDLADPTNVSVTVAGALNAQGGIDVTIQQD